MKYVILIFSFFFSFLLLELFTRIIIDDGMNYEIEMQKYATKLKKISKNNLIGIEHKKNKSAVLMGAEVALNSYGFRSDTDFNRNEKKILMLGDSMTFGWGARKPFSNVLNYKFTKYEVINAGIGNTNTLMQIENFFQNFKDLYPYEMIVLNFYINDFENIKISHANLIQKYSYLYTFIFNKINYLLIKYKVTDDWKKFYSKQFNDDEIKLNTFAKILKLKKYCEDNNIKFLIHNIPELRNLKKYSFQNETNLLENFASKNNIEFINSIDILKKFDESSLWVTKHDSHANDRAHDLIADFFIKKFPEY
tara:strand:+ start:7062 stop:7985 length:924 start_codon:yes stop_codon:yes gene_type:complete